MVAEGRRYAGSYAISYGSVGNAFGPAALVIGSALQRPLALKPTKPPASMHQQVLEGARY